MKSSKILSLLPAFAVLVSSLPGCARGAPPGKAPLKTTSTEPDNQATTLAQSTVTLRVLSERFWGSTTFTTEGNGSGFIVDSPRGPVIVTAAHVVAGASEIAVIGPRGRRRAGTRLLAFDERFDLAVVDSELANELPALSLGEAPEVGDDIILVSSPLGLSTTVAFGVVAADRKKIDALQLSAPVSPGSSGGLVADREGLAVGIIRSKASTSVDAEGIALATPISRLEQLLDDLEPLSLSPRPDRGQMQVTAQHVLATLESTTFRSFRASASVAIEPAAPGGEHLCASAGEGVFVAIVNDDGAREGLGEACATLAGGARADVWIGTEKRARVEVTIRRQHGGA